MKSRIFAITLIIIATITIVSFIGWFLLKPAEYIMQGEVDATSIKVSSQLSGRVDSLLVKRGDAVSKGQLLFVIGSKTINAKLAQAEAAKDAATAMQQKADAGVRRQQISQAYEMWQASTAALELAGKTYTRVQNLYDSGVLPEQKLDEAKARLDAARNTSAAAEAQYSLAREGAQREDKAAAWALVNQAGGAVSEVESYISDARQYAPIDAEVSSIIARQGELVGQGFPVVTLVDLNDSWVVFNLKETLLPKITMGTKFTGYFPALDKSYQLEVTYIAAEASYATWAATRTTGEFDIRTFEVHARPVEKIGNLRPGMSVTVDDDSIK